MAGRADMSDTTTEPEPGAASPLADVADPTSPTTAGWAGSKTRSRKDGAAIALDELDRKLLNLMQGSFPIAPRPYRHVAEQGGVSEREVMDRVQHLLDKRIIRQVTPIFDTRALGYSSMLVAAKVDPEHPSPRGPGHQPASRRLAQLPAQPRVQPVVHDRHRARLRAWAGGHAGGARA